MIYETQTNYQYTMPEEISYLLDKQDNLKNKLVRYNETVSSFEDKRDDFFKSLYDRNMIKELKEAIKVFDTVAYVDTEQPDFIVVSITDIYDAIPIVEDEYTIVKKEDLDNPIIVESTGKQLSKETIDRILSVPRIATAHDLFKTASSGCKEHVLFEILDDAIILNNKQYMLIKNEGIEHIVDYSDCIYQLLKKHYTKYNSVIDGFGVKPTINENTKKIVCTWA
jgi:hypothetical protein